jgi:hypothetical protein
MFSLGPLPSTFKMNVKNCSVFTCVHLEAVMKILICSTKISFTLPEAFGSHTVTLKCDSRSFLLKYLTITQCNCKQQLLGNEGAMSH